MPTGRARSARRSSMAVPGRVTAGPSRWKPRRCSSRITTKVTSPGRAMSAIRRSSPATPIARPATKSPAAAVVRCWLASSVAVAAADGSRSSTRALPAADLPMYQSQPATGTTRLPRFQRSPHRRGDRHGDVACRGADGDRGCGGGRAHAEGRGQGPTAHRRAGAATSSVRCVTCGTPLCGL